MGTHRLIARATEDDSGASAMVAVMLRMIEGERLSIATIRSSLTPMGVNVDQILVGLMASGLITIDGEGMTLTDQGRLVLVCFHTFC